MEENVTDKLEVYLKDLEEQNIDLKEPMALPKTKVDEQLIEMEMQKATKKLESSENSPGSNNKKNAKKDQKAAAKKKE